MKFTELIDQGATENEKRSYLADGDTVAITIRIPKNLKDAAAEKANLQGLSFSAYTRICMIGDLLSSDQLG